MRPTTWAPATARATVKSMVGRVARRARRALHPPRRLRGAAVQRRDHLLLGRRHLRADRAAEPAPELRRVLLEVRRRGRGRALPRGPRGHQVRVRAPTRGRWPTGDVDLYGLTHNETSTGVSMQIRRPSGAALRPTAAGWWPSTPPRRPGGLRVDPARVRLLLLRAAEVLRLRRWAVAGALLAGGHRADRADRRLRPLDPRLLRPQDGRRQLAARTRPTTRRRWPPSTCWPTRSSG